MLGGGTIGQVDRFLASGGDDDAAMPRQRFARRPCRRHLGGDGSGDFQSQRRLVVMRIARALGIVLGLCDEVRRYPLGIAFVGRDDDFSRTCIEVDCAIPGDERFGRGDVLVSGPTILSTRGTVAVPYARAAIACAPPMRNSRLTPAARAAAITIGAGLGHATITSRTPAARAGMAVINNDEGRGYRPPGT